MRRKNKIRTPDIVVRTKTATGTPQRLRLYINERYVTMHKVLISDSDVFKAFSVFHRKFEFTGRTIWYYHMVQVITKTEFLLLKKMLIQLEPILGYSQLWFNLENETGEKKIDQMEKD